MADNKTFYVIWSDLCSEENSVRYNTEQDAIYAAGKILSSDDHDECAIFICKAMQMVKPDKATPPPMIVTKLK